MRMVLSVLGPLLLLSSLASGCTQGEAGAQGVVVVPFELGNRKDCDALGVSHVRAELEQGLFVEEVECGAGKVRFDLVPAGTYAVQVYGLDADGVAVMDSLASEVVLDVVGEGTTIVADPAVKLSAAPAQLLLRWDLGFGTCESAAIDAFLVTAWRQDGSELLLDLELPCSMSGEGVEQYRPVPDPSRQLSGDELGEVTIQAFDPSGVAVGDPAVFLFDTPGPGRPVKLSLECDLGGCEGTGQPD